MADSLRYCGNYALAKITYLHAMQGAQDVRDTLYEGHLSNALGYVYSSSGNNLQATERFLRAQKIALSINDKDILGDAQSGMANLNARMGRYNEAIAYHRQALESRAYTRDSKALLNNYVNLGQCYINIGLIDSARFYISKSLHHDSVLQYPRTFAAACNAMAEHFYASALYDSVSYYNNLALHVYDTLADNPGLVNCLLLNGKINMLRGEELSNSKLIKVAENNFMKALNIAHTMDAKSKMLVCYMALSGLYTRQHKFEKALSYTNEYVALNNILRDSATSRQIAEIEAKYELDRKNKEIQILSFQRVAADAQMQKQRLTIVALSIIAVIFILAAIVIYRNIQHKRSAERKLAATQQQVALQTMRTKFSMDIHDDIGSGLTKVALYAQALKSGNDTPMLAAKIIKLAKDINAGMREIIWTASPASDNLHDMLAFMRVFIHKFFEETTIVYTIHFDEDSPNIALQPDVKRNIFLALKEALNNVVKHANANAVDIIFRLEDQLFEFSIADNGVGATMPILELPQSQHHGLANIKLRMHAIDATTQIVNNDDGGMTLIIKGKLY